MILKVKKSCGFVYIDNIYRIDIEQIKKIPIDRITKINRAGFFINNPFRKERSPSNSLHLNRKTNRWSDYGSGEYGDNIDLYMNINNCNFIEACKELQIL